MSLCVVKQRDDVIAFSSPSVNKRSHREAIPGRRRHAGSEHFDVLEVGSILFILSHFLVSVKVFFFFVPAARRWIAVHTVDFL